MPIKDNSLETASVVVSDVLDYPIPVPEGFPRGPGLDLTNNELRQALCFSKASHLGTG